MRLRVALLTMLATSCSTPSASAPDAGRGSSLDAGHGRGLACVPASPPSPPWGSLAPPADAVHNYALMQLFLGDTDRMGNPSPTAWQALGYDQDGKITTTSSTDVCTLVPGASKQVQVDGDRGIDNSWGANLVPLLLMVDPEGPAQINREIEGGDWTSMTYVVGFDDSMGNTRSAVGLSGVQLTGARYPGGPPPWNTSTNWPVDPTSVEDCSYPAGCAPGTDPVASAVTTFGNAFQNKGVFATEALQGLTLPLSFAGMRLVLNIQDAFLSFEPKMPGAVHNGTIAGVILASDLANQLAQQMGPTPSLCQGTAYQSVVQQIEQMADIVLDGTTVVNSLGFQCNAISIGLGFNADEIALPTDIALPTPPQPDLCPDGG